MGSNHSLVQLQQDILILIMSPRNESKCFTHHGICMLALSDRFQVATDLFLQTLIQAEYYPYGN